MCGRYLLHAGSRLLERAFGITEFSETPRDLAPRFNVAPTQLVPIVRTKPGRELTIVRRADGSAERELASVRWQGSRMSVADDEPEHVVVVPGGLLAPAA